MGQSLAKVIVHVTFSTKNRMPLVPPEELPALHAYLAGVLRQSECSVFTIGGTADHIHAVFCLSRTVALATIVKDMKTASAKWLKGRGARYAEFAWQTGYAAFSLGQSGVETATRYVARQAAHHRDRTYQEELREFLVKYRVAYDEQYVWD